jgi:ornithine cyclodeaminase/alanine dehydrogenase-like protein (mu-crystallin family)
MAVTLGFDALQGALKMSEAIDLLERAFTHEAAGRAYLSPKFVSNFEGGAMRMLFAADYEAGYSATKNYQNVRGSGARFLVALYSLKDGELLALLDGRHITDMRTGAASGVVARRVGFPGPVTVGLIGSGHQARAQLECLAAVYRIARAAVYSPTQGNREAFAREMSGKLGFPVEPVATAQAAVHGHPVVAAASSARGTEPVLRGEWLGSCRLLCAVGNTRAQFAEIDLRSIQDATLVVVDTSHALEESGELRRAVEAGALPETKRATLGQIVTGAVTLPNEGMIVFKSVGTALQDLALAARYYELIGASLGVPTAPDLASAK